MPFENPVLQLLDDPVELESLYASKPQAFDLWLGDATASRPESETLRVWNARLRRQPPSKTGGSSTPALRVFVVALTAALLAKANWIPGVPDDWFIRFRPLIVFGSLIAYFSWSRPSHRSAVTWLGSLACVAMVALLPVGHDSSSVTMSLIYLPLVMLSLLGVVFMGPTWRDSAARVLFVRYCGEMLIYASVILLGGVVLTLVTETLLRAIEIRATGWYYDWVVGSGLIAAPVVGTFVYDAVLKRDSRVATILSNVFAPLFLVTACGYLVTMVLQGASPYSDRDSLIAVNGLLIVVLAIVIYSLCGRNPGLGSRFQDGVNAALVAVTLAINAAALSAIVFRWAEFGMTPNRVAVTGANILIFIHLTLILVAYFRVLRGHDRASAPLHEVTRYLPIYSGWSVLMAFGLPLTFHFA